MTFEELPLHTAFRLVDGYSTSSLWEKIGEDGRCIRCAAIQHRSVDAPRGRSGINAYEQKHGTNYLPKSHLLSWLNSNDELWTQNMPDDNGALPSDELYDEHTYRGFLQYLPKGAATLLLPWDMPVHCPGRYKQEPDHVKVLAGLPDDKDVAESQYIGSIDHIILRTIHSNSCGQWNGEKSIALLPSVHANLHPVIRIKPDTNVSINELGLYYIDTSAYYRDAVYQDLMALLAL